MVARGKADTVMFFTAIILLCCACAVTPALSLEIELKFPELVISKGAVGQTDSGASRNDIAGHPNSLSDNSRSPTRTCGRYAGAQLWCRAALEGYGRLVVVPPYPALDLRAVFDYKAKLYPIFGWAKIAEVIHGRRVVRNLRRMAASAKIFCRSDSDCIRVVRAWSQRNGRRIDGVASCLVRKIGDRYSPPINCSYLQIVIDQGRGRHGYIWSVRGYHPPVVVAYVGRSDFEVAIPPREVREFITSLAKRMENAPYSAFTHVTDSRLDAAADYKYFSPLGLFSVFTISIYQEGTSLANDLTFLAVATSLNVSAQTASNEDSYRLAPRPVFNKFLDTLRGTMLAELQHLCPKMSQSGKYISDPGLAFRSPPDITVTRCR
jgi:hypothetical protein